MKQSFMFAEIQYFKGEYRFLSNFYIEPDGSHVEGEYQAAKCADPTDAQKFVGLDPLRAKRLGGTVRLRPDWAEVKRYVMFDLVLKKFMDHPDLLQRLISTGSEDLYEGNNWHDVFWGVCDGKCRHRCNGGGDNNLGKILETVRFVLS